MANETPEPGKQPDAEPKKPAPETPDGSASRNTGEAVPEKRKRAKPLRLKAAVILPLLFAIAAGTYYFMIDGVIADVLVSQGASYAGEDGEAKVDDVSFSIFGPKLTVRNFEAWQNRPDREVHEVIFVEEAIVDVEFWPLLERRVVVNELTVTKIRLQQPIAEKADEEESDVPTDTSNKNLNDYLKDVKEILDSEEVADLRELLKKFRDHMEKKEPEPEGEEAKEAVETDAIGPAGRAWYVVEALKQKKAAPRVVVKKMGVQELGFTFGEKDENKFAYKVTDLDVVGEEISSDPIAYSRPMKFTAAGNLDGDVGRRVELGLLLRFDPEELIAIEQVDGAAGFASLPISSLVDPGVFGDTIRDASLSITHYSPTHTDFAGRTKIQLSGLVQPPGLPKASKANVALWFGGFKGGTTGAMAPSGVSVSVEDFPLAPVLDLAGGSPLPLKNRNATISFGTCDENGRTDGPGAAFSWNNGVNVHMRLKVDGLEFADPQGELGGLPGTFMVRGLNRVITGMGGLDIVVGFKGNADELGLNLEKPGLRSFVDAIVNALTLTAPEIKSMIDLPFEISGDSEFGLASVDANGAPRDPKLTVEGEAQHDLTDLRVALNLRGITSSPKPGQTSVMGLPASDFCKAFNAFMGSFGDEGLTLQTRIMNANGQFSPALESPGVRGFVDGMAGVLAYSGKQFNQSFDLPLTLSPNTNIQCESVDARGNVRGLNSPGSDSDDLSGLRLRVRADNFTVSPKPGEKNILGIPADQFCKCFNAFIQAQGDKGLALDWGLLDAQGNFAPTLKQPGTRGLLDGVVNTLNFTGAELNQNFNLPFKLDDRAKITSASVNADNSRRKMDGPNSASNDLKDLRIQLVLKDGYAAKKAGVNTIYGVPADYFTFAWNKMQGAFAQQGFPLQLKLFNDKGAFAPSVVKPDEQEMLKMMGSFVGINDFEANFDKLAQRFVKEFPAFKKDGLKVAEDIARGRFKLPGKDDKEDDGKKNEPPEIPDIKLPWGK